VTERHCAFLTLEERGDFVIDDELAIPALEAAGWRVHTVPWRQTSQPWNVFDVVVVRSTWDYWDAIPAFVRVLERIDAETLLANPLPLLRWNLSKTYLRELEAQAVPIVPTHWCDHLRPRDLEAAAERFATADLVLKPQVGGNGQGVMRLAMRAGEETLRSALERYRATPCMLQPFRPSILQGGEWSLFAFRERFSHAICKRPAEGEFRTQEERGAAITSAEPSADLRAAMAKALEALPCSALYARIDLIDTPGLGPELVELELIEPSLYFRTDPRAPDRFAAALNAWCASPPARGLGTLGEPRGSEQ
jgi:glutathione synthase/RimK-type ligase-like ATP-grasp enzyme